MIDKIFSYNPSNGLRKAVFILLDIIAFSISLFLSFQIRLDYSEIVTFNLPFLFALFIILKLFIFSLFKLYDISWKYVSLHDLNKIAKALVISNTFLFVLVYGVNNPVFNGFPKSIFLIDLVFSFLFTSGFKISKRMYLEVMRQSIKKSELKTTLIIGAGSSGEQLLRDINRSRVRKFQTIGFIDDDPAKQNLYIQGIKVLGTTAYLPDIIKKYNVETVLISVLTADRQFHRRMLNLARESGIKDVKIVSTINDISNSVEVRVQDIKDIDACDLIGRQAVSINTKDIAHYIENKRVLITGAAGSIGSEIARQVTFYQPSKIAILDINESDLADLELQLGREYPASKIKMYLADISHESKINKIIENFRPEIIFHAAAYKHVPVMEKYPEEAVRVNILGTNNLTKAAKRFGVKNFIFISTDKAVNPTSIMGASKRVAEYIVTTAGKNSPGNFSAVRFGNVIGSRGSALPIFLEQLKKGGPITVTHPEMKRYFMTIPEAVALVLQAATTGSSGDVFVLDMGEPVKIVDLVKDLIMLNNLIPDHDIKIDYIGLREGEKLFEEVLTAEEGVLTTKHEKIFKAKMSDRHTEETIKNMLTEFASLNGHTTKEEWLQVFKYYVPTYNNPNLKDINTEEVINKHLTP